MTTAVWMAAWLAASLSLVAQSPTAADDAAVYAAVLTSDLLGWARSSFVADETVAMCGPTSERERVMSVRAVPGFPPGCIGSIDVAAIVGRAIGGSRTELADAFAAANASSHPFPALTNPKTQLVTRGQFPPAFAAFSRPAYTADGHAVVYAGHHCTGLCASGRVVILERVEGPEKRWRVVSVRVIWMS